MCNSDPGSQFNVAFWPGVTIQRGILTRGQNSTWNLDLSTYHLPVELRLKKASTFNSLITIQQLWRVTIQRKMHWILTPGRFSMEGSKFYLTTAHRCTGGLKKIDLRSGSQRHRHSVGFFNMPVQALTRGHPFHGYSEKPPHLVAFTTRMGIRRTYSRKPRGSPRGYSCYTNGK